jgi:hypothetical protein
MTVLDPKTEALALRAVIQAKLTEAQKPISALVLTHEATAAAISEALINHRNMQRLLLKPFETQSGTRYETPESEISLYLEDLRMKIDQARSLRARSLADLQAARLEVDKLQRSLNQIVRAIPVEETEEAACKQSAASAAGSSARPAQRAGHFPPSCQLARLPATATRLTRADGFIRQRCRSSIRTVMLRAFARCWAM